MMSVQYHIYAPKNNMPLKRELFHVRDGSWVDLVDLVSVVNRGLGKKNFMVINKDDHGTPSGVTVKRVDFIGMDFDMFYGGDEPIATCRGSMWSSILKIVVKQGADVSLFAGYM